jgi:NADH-quinone oxidoreductase subunit L
MPEAFKFIWLVQLLPLVGCLIQALVGKRIVTQLGPKAGKKVMGTLAVLPIALAFVIGAWITSQLAGMPKDGRTHVVYGGEWISIASIRIPFELVVDPLSMTMVLIITGIGALIHLYATGYMAEEKDYTRFFTYLNLFIASMLILVLGNNLALLFIGWEGVGVCSYLLIGFWYKDLANAKAANKAFIVNRIGDWGLTLGLFLIFALLAGNYNPGAFTDGRFLSYDQMLPALQTILSKNSELATAIALLLFVGACGKSAQFPLYLWLPDAMAGPTPVSALIHAATMVTSGVVLLSRMHVVFEYSAIASGVVVVVGAFTALFAALIAFGQTDIKKVLAYSTVSQLGFMFIGCGAGAYWTGMFHVTTHAFFKALLFLGAGAVIHAMAHDQDMRNYGNLRKYIPITFATMMVGWIAIAGLSIPIPLLGAPAIGFAGFYSKEVILGSALANQHASIGGVNLSLIAGWTGLGVAALTAMYMTRMTWLTFFGNQERWRLAPAGHGHDHAHDHDEHGHEAHHDHVGDHGHHHDDPHGFFYTNEELAAQHASDHDEHDHHHAISPDHTPHEVPPSMWIPLVALAFLSVVGGIALYKPLSLEKWLYPSGLPILGKVEYHPHGLPISLLWLSIIAATTGVVLGLAIYWKGLPGKEGWDLSKWSPFRKWAGNQFGYDNAMVDASVSGGAQLGTFAWKGFDVAVIDGTVNGVAKLVGGIGTLIRNLQTGYARTYAMVMLAGGVILLGWLMFAVSNARSAAPPPGESVETKEVATR